MPRIVRSSPATDCSTFAFDDFAAQANAELAEARLAAAELLNEAQQQARQIRDQAEAEARQAREEHEQRVARRVAAELTTVTEALEQAAGQFAAARAECLQRWEQSALRVTVAIAERVIRRELKHEPHLSLPLVREALDLAAGGTQLQLHMHPDDLAHVQPHVEALLAEHGLPPGTLIADGGVSRGGCRVQTRAGTIDQQIETQLARIEQELS